METRVSEITSNFLWSLFGRWGPQIVSFVVSIILARLLEPVMYGTIALITVFTSILSVFIDCGFGSALVQKKDADDTDFSTVFYFNVVACILLYFIMFFCAGPIARFYDMPELVPLVRVVSLTLVLGGFRSILVAYIQRNLLYRLFFFGTLGGTLLSAVLGIGAALLGFGVWALVIQTLSSTLTDVIILWVMVKWRPKLVFSLSRLKGLFSFGWKILATTLVGNIYSNLRQLIIGKGYTAEDLAFYNKASGWPNLLFTAISGAVDSVMYPVMSRAQDDLVEVKLIMSKTINTNTFIVFPLMMGLAVCAEPAVCLILTDKWLPIVPYMRIFCVTAAVSVVGNTCMNSIRSIGRSDVFLKLSIAKYCIDLVALLATMWISVMAIAYSLIVSTILGQLVTMFVVRKLVGYSFKDQLGDYLPCVGLSVVMGIPVLALTFLPLADWLMIVVQIVVGIAVYYLLSRLFYRKTLDYFFSLVRGLLHKEKATDAE